MKSWLKISAISIGLSFSFHATAGDAEVQKLKDILQNKYPSTSFTEIKETPISELYQVVMGKNIAFVDKSGRYFVFGKMFDMQEQKDLTSTEQEQLERVDFNSLPLNNAIKVVKGNGKRVFAVFTDPDCPYCKQFESTVSRMEDYTMYIFLYPIASLHPNARAVAEAIWCNKNSAKAFEGYVLDGITPKNANCKNPLDSNIALAEKLGISGTPSLIHKNGKLAAGAMPRSELESWLGEVK